MRIRPLSFFIVPFGFVLAVLLALALVLAIVLPSKAKAAEPDMNKVCRVMAEMTAKACWIAAEGKDLKGDDQTFALKACNGAGDAALKLCLNEPDRSRYAEMPTCKGLATFTYDSINTGGAATLDALTVLPAVREGLLSRVRGWATRAAVGLFNACRVTEEKQKEQERPKHPLPGDNGFDV